MSFKGIYKITWSTGRWLVFWLLILASFMARSGQSYASEAASAANEDADAELFGSEALELVADAEDHDLLHVRRRRLSPPQWVFWGRTNEALGADPCFTVGEPVFVKDSTYQVTITTNCDESLKASSLAALLLPSYTASTRKGGMVQVRVSIVDASGQAVKPVVMPSDPQEATKVFTDALTGNPNFVSIGPRTHLAAFSLVFAKEVAQYWADNLGDCFGNNNELVAFVMRDTLGLDTHRWPFIVGVGIAEKKMPVRRRA